MNIAASLHSASEYYQKGDHEKAEYLCREIIRAHPGNTGAYFILGNIVQSRNQFENSTRCYQEVLRRDPRHFGAHLQLGMSLYNRRLLDEAAASFQAALRLNPRSDEAYCSLGMILREQGQLDKAIAHFRKALEINPDSAWAYTNLGIAMQHRGEYEEGKKFLRTALEKNTYIRNADRTLGNLLVRDRETLRGRMNLQKQIPRKMLIAVPAFNRKKITALALGQMKRYKPAYCRLQVYNDHSSEYDNAFLADHADEVIQLPEKMGIDRLRWHQFGQFLKTDFDFLYMTDNDVIHDPGYVGMLEELYAKGNGRLPVSLFSNIFMLQPRLILLHENGVYLKTSAPGASMFFDRKMVETIVTVAGNIGSIIDYLAWDNKAVACLRLPWIAPEQSYLEHFGAGGLHSDNYERERAINLTEYLQERREPILQYLAEGDDLRINW